MTFDGDVVSVNNDLHLHRFTNTRDEVPHDISGIAWPRNWGLIIMDQPAMIERANNRKGEDRIYAAIEG